MTSYVGNSLLAHANGGCYRCGRGDSLVDMDAQIVGEGALVLCKGCISDAAESAGLTFNAAHLAEVRAAFEEERRQFSPEAVADLRQQLAETQKALDAALEVESLLQDIAAGTKGKPVNRRPSR